MWRILMYSMLGADYVRVDVQYVGSRLYVRVDVQYVGSRLYVRVDLQYVGSRLYVRVDVQYVGSRLYVRVSSWSWCLATRGLRRCQTAVRTIWPSPLILLISSFSLNNCTEFFHFIWRPWQPVGKANRHGPNGLGMESRCGETFSLSDHTYPEAHPPFIQWVPGFSWG
jgi:hypothetical protein